VRSFNGRRRHEIALIGCAVLLAWLGMFIHNMADLPGLRFMSLETSGPALIWLLGYGGWIAAPGRRWPAVLLFAWGALNLIGGAASVLPLALMPFKPAQSLRHYAFHVLYAGSQLPIIALIWPGSGMARRAADRQARRWPDHRL
jgi:hypothetical protein